jgi:hypothetical protein
MTQPSTECKTHERPWRDWAVDLNLDDQWLERLNNLETFNLINICEGHIDVYPTSVKRSPRIILRPKEAYIRPLTVHWYDLKKALAAEIERIWPGGESIVEFEIQHRLVKNEDPLEDIEDIIVRVTSERKRDMMILSAWIQKWFRQTLSRIEAFDRFMKTLIIIKEEQG